MDARRIIDRPEVGDRFISIDTCPWSYRPDRHTPPVKGVERGRIECVITGIDRENGQLTYQGIGLLSVDGVPPSGPRVRRFPLPGGTRLQSWRELFDLGVYEVIG